MEHQFKINFSKEVENKKIEPSRKHAPETASVLSHEPETLDLHDPEFWEDLEKSKDEDPDTYYEIINKIVSQQEAEYNQRGIERESETSNKDDESKRELDALYEKGDDIYDLHQKYADLAKRVPSDRISKKSEIN